MTAQFWSFGSTSMKTEAHPPDLQTQPPLPPPLGAMRRQLVQNRTLPSGCISTEVMVGQLWPQPQLPQPKQSLQW
jgi:hypothetical protein